MERNTLQAEIRQVQGKGAARTLRRKGITPCVIYRKGKESLLNIASKDLVSFINAAAGDQKLVDLKFPDGSSKIALVKDYQLDPIKGSLLHADFIEVSMLETLRVSVAVVLTGTPIGVKRDGGLLQHGLREIEIEGLPDKLPAHVEVDVTSLTIGHSLHVKDLKPGEGIEVLTDPDDLIATISTTAALVSETEETAPGTQEPVVIKKGKQEEKGS